jgi:Domain of unknown function (DUF205).
LVLATDWKYFIILLIIGCVLTLIFNYGCCISFSAAILFPILYAIETKSVVGFLVLMCCSCCIILKHKDNIEKIRSGIEMPVRDFILEHIIKRGL